jgi:hypothetical protein
MQKTIQEKWAEINWRGEDLYENFYFYCKCCQHKQRLFRRLMSSQNREIIEIGSVINCPVCLTSKRITKTAEVVEVMPVHEAINALWYMSQGGGIDYEEAEKQFVKEMKQEKQAEYDEAHTRWLLDKVKK